MNWFNLRFQDLMIKPVIHVESLMCEDHLLAAECHRIQNRLITGRIRSKVSLNYADVR